MRAPSPRVRRVRGEVNKRHQSRGACASEFCHASLEPSQSSLERREAERRETLPTGSRTMSCGARLFSVVPRFTGEDRGPMDSLDPLERARSPFGAPPRFHRGFTLGSARAALPGTTGCKREDPLRHQCSEHLAVRHWAGRADAQAARARSVWLHSRAPPPLRIQEYPREGVLRERDFGYVTLLRTYVKSIVTKQETVGRMGRALAKPIVQLLGRMMGFASLYPSYRATALRLFASLGNQCMKLLLFCCTVKKRGWEK